MSATQANPAEFQDGGKPIANPVYLVDSSGNPITSATNNGLAITQPTSSTGTLTSVASATSSTQLLAANAARKGASFFNDSTATLYLALANSASLTAYTVQIPPNGFFEIPAIPVYTGAVYGIWSAIAGNARITEMN